MKKVLIFLLVLILTVGATGLFACKKEEEPPAEEPHTHFFEQGVCKECGEFDPAYDRYFKFEATADGKYLMSAKKISIPDLVVVPSKYNGIAVFGIEKSGFDSKDNINVVMISEGVESIGEQAFSNCHELVKITIPESIQIINRYAFHGCSKLTEIIFSGTKEEWKKVEKIGSWHYLVPATLVRCSDGEIGIDE